MLKAEYVGLFFIQLHLQLLAIGKCLTQKTPPHTVMLHLFRCV